MNHFAQENIAKFMTTFKQWNGHDKLAITDLSPEDRKTYLLRLRLSFEETFELLEAMFSKDTYESVFKPWVDQFETLLVASEHNLEIDPVSIFDSLVDQEYVNMGFANLLGLDMYQGHLEVHRSNMSKLDKDGLPIFREDGKALKSELYSPPDLEAVYQTFRFRGE